MTKKAKWGEARVLFFCFRETIEKDIKKAIPKKHIWSKYKDRLNCSYSAFLKLCKKYIILENEISANQNNKLDTDNIDNLTNITTEQKPKSIRPSLTGRKINFTPEPSRERFKQWLSRADDKNHHHY